ncbi:MAG: hypothetical protein EXR99_15800 [Gemmataceae bacterium]|nr:hypothetical protein [Gemmataceae bacterium]
MRNYLSPAILFLGLAGVSFAGESTLKLHWDKNYLTIRGDFPGREMKILYLEAYCRPGSTDRDWGQTVIRHRAELVSASADGKVIRLKDTLADGVTVEHTITAGKDEVDFRLQARNPTLEESQAHWAQPCVRVENFTGATTKDARERVPQYARKCFLIIDNKMVRMPTEPWAEKARYIPGQVYCPKGVSRDDVNPRPLSRLVPSNGLTGCFSADDKQVMAMAWEPYQEVFLGVITCIHNDFRIGGLKPGETKQIRGKIYFLPADTEAMLQRFEKDFPEQARKK